MTRITASLSVTWSKQRHAAIISLREIWDARE